MLLPYSYFNVSQVIPLYRILKDFGLVHNDQKVCFTKWTALPKEYLLVFLNSFLNNVSFENRKPKNNMFNKLTSVRAKTSQSYNCNLKKCLNLIKLWKNFTDIKNHIKTVKTNQKTFACFTEISSNMLHIFCKSKSGNQELSKFTDHSVTHMYPGIWICYRHKYNKNTKCKQITADILQINFSFKVTDIK